MFFYCYNVQSYLPDTLYLYGRKLEIEYMKNIEEVKTKQLKITVGSVISPIIAVINNEQDNENLKKDLKDFFGKMHFMEEDALKNIFYEDLEKEITVIRFKPYNTKNIKDFKSKFCSKIFQEFANPLETALISKKIKTPCVLELQTNKTFINLEDIVAVHKTNMPKLNFASLDLNLQNFDILSYSICINGSKYYAGALKGHQPNKKMEDCSLEIFTNFTSLNNRINSILINEDVDGIIYFNSLGNLWKLCSRLIICDMYQYASANIKCREFSIEELCKYFNIKNEGSISKILYELFLKSDVLLLSKELSELSGYTLNKVMSNNRAEIIEYALFHDLYNNKYILPPEKHIEQEKYTGGLVLEPKKDCYENLVLLLDFNSLYPSIIQEYNVCFSNLDFKSEEKGFLPKILNFLVKRRKEVKKLMKSQKDSKIFNIRQLALKILANSIYGCLGYPKSRFCNYKMASFITNKGREILMDTKTSIENVLSLEVIYGDTDSIMIDTKLKYDQIFKKDNINNIRDQFKDKDNFDCDSIKKAKEISLKVKEYINSKYKNIEIDLEKIFIRLYLYSKKKYVGKFLDMNNNINEEYKGIDVVKRNFCNVTVDILKKVLKILLDSDNSDIYKFLESEYENLPFRDIKDFVINNVLSKPPSQYLENTPQPFVHLCNRLKGIQFKAGDVISFVIGKSDKDEPYHKRAFLPTENFTLDLDYYIEKQILPPLLRILSISKYSNIDRIYKIFNRKNTKSCSVVTQLKFKTDCCQVLQNPQENCKECNKIITEEFYLKEVKNMIKLEMQKSFSTPFRCIDCKVNYEGFFFNCLYCMQELDFKPRNYEFDVFLEDLISKFQGLKYQKVLEVIGMHMESSEFRVFDISRYYCDEISVMK